MALFRDMAGAEEIFSEIVINHNLTIPDHKPPMERLLGYKIEYEIIKAEVIDTKLTTDDDPPLPIRKVLIDGVAKIAIKYVALVPDQQVHGAHFEEPFHDLIEWPGGPAPGSPICVEILEEHVQIHMVDERHLSKVIVIQFNITPDDQ
ncbi:DUF3794 domain-containing protein [Metallumcola ferriviriculae]|uniref:DUF3794 domain-containing protein n=1 Tax=Metallumcola ferriviriculae TaxID=3039180 RepID=A0AAU0UM57_9FIRM|nr:DUF3794 domain-containing protein [Desulfitibacteraceae bacterium MK1]